MSPGNGFASNRRCRLSHVRVLEEREFVRGTVLHCACIYIYLERRHTFEFISIIIFRIASSSINSILILFKEVRIIYLGEPLILKPATAARTSETLHLLTLVIPQRSDYPACVHIISREKNHLIFLVIGILKQLTTVFRSLYKRPLTLGIFLLLNNIL